MALLSFIAFDRSLAFKELSTIIHSRDVENGREVHPQDPIGLRKPECSKNLISPFISSGYSTKIPDPGYITLAESRIQS